MLEIKVNIESKDLSQAIVQLAMAINQAGAKTAPSGQDVVVPVNTSMTAVAVDPVPAPPIPAPEPAVAPMPQPVPVQPIPMPEPMPTESIPTPIQPIPESIVPETKQVTLDMISRAGAALVDQGKMGDVLRLLQNKYKIQAVTQLTAEQYPAFADDLRALGAVI